MRILLRAILSVALLLGGGLGDWSALGSTELGQGHEACCCGTPAGLPDTCPCPQPDGNRTPTKTACVERQASVSLLAEQQAPAKRRLEASPVPAGWVAVAVNPIQSLPTPGPAGRDVDLGRHLARLSLLRI